MDFGDGTITNIFGFYDADGSALIDVDSSPQSALHIQGWTPYRQWSNELRYAGRFFESLHATTGFYYFTNEISYHDRRYLSGGALTQDLGGNYYVDTLGVFLSFDYDLTDRVMLTAGTRYSYEKREAETASGTFGPPCNVATDPRASLISPTRRPGAAGRPSSALPTI